MAFGWRPYVPVAKRKAQSKSNMDKLRKKGLKVQPITVEGRKIAHSFWGRAWCAHIESFSDYSNRLPRGRTYVRNGSVCHLAITEGKIEAIVSGSQLYTIRGTIKPLAKNQWLAMKNACAGQIGSILELVQGKLSDNIMRLVTDPQRGIFPRPKDINLDCDCPDWASLCKHLAAVLYGIGSRLDKEPELLFVLRGIDHTELITADITVPKGTGQRRRIAGDMSDIFGIELDSSVDTRNDDDSVPAAKARASTKKSSKKNTPQTQKEKPAVAKKITPAVNKKKVPKTKPVAKTIASSRSKKTVFKPTGATVRRLRKRLAMNKSQFSVLIGVTANAISVWENKIGQLSIKDQSKTALAIARDLEQSTAWAKVRNRCLLSPSLLRSVDRDIERLGLNLDH